MTKNKDNSKEWKYSNQSWKKVLREIVDYAPNRYGRGKSNYGEDHPLVNKLKIKPHELMLIMSFLNDQGLIEYDSPDYNWITLTPKGFDVALKNRDHDLAFRTNFVVIFLTAIVAFTTVVSLVSAGVNWAAWSATILFFIGLGFILIKVIRRSP